MNLIIDVGNSYTKLALFEQNNMVCKVQVETKDCMVEIKNLQAIHKKFEHAIVSSVGNLDKMTIKFLRQSYKLQTLRPETKLPFKNLYTTPKTLGIDRIALVCASVKMFPNCNVLIIDAGTCITFDFVNTKNEYKGGAISPGIRMRYKAMHNQTANLPLLDTEIVNDIVGNSTAASMHSGVLFGVVNEIDGHIEKYLEKYSNLTVILTGGDTKILSKQLKSSIFADSNFLLEGLNFILQYNSH